MKTIKMSLCPPCPDCPPSSECPEVQIADDQLTIGQPGNIATLTHRQERTGRTNPWGRPARRAALGLKIFRLHAFGGALAVCAHDHDFFG